MGVAAMKATAGLRFRSEEDHSRKERAGHGELGPVFDVDGNAVFGPKGVDSEPGCGEDSANGKGRGGPWRGSQQAPMPGKDAECDNHRAEQDGVVDAVEVGRVANTGAMEAGVDAVDGARSLIECERAGAECEERGEAPAGTRAVPGHDGSHEAPRSQCQDRRDLELVHHASVVVAGGASVDGR